MATWFERFDRVSHQVGKHLTDLNRMGEYLAVVLVVTVDRYRAVLDLPLIHVEDIIHNILDYEFRRKTDEAIECERLSNDLRHAPQFLLRVTNQCTVLC